MIINYFDRFLTFHSILLGIIFVSSLMDDSGRSSGGAWKGLLPLFLDQTAARNSKKFFWRPETPEHAIALVQLNGFLSLLAKKLVF